MADPKTTVEKPQKGLSAIKFKFAKLRSTKDEVRPAIIVVNNLSVNVSEAEANPIKFIKKFPLHAIKEFTNATDAQVEEIKNMTNRQINRITK